MQLKTLPSKCAAQTQPSKLISGFYIWQYITRLFMICSQKIISWFFSRTKKWAQKLVSENQYTIVLDEKEQPAVAILTILFYQGVFCDVFTSMYFPPLFESDTIRTQLQEIWHNFLVIHEQNFYFAVFVLSVLVICLFCYSRTLTLAWKIWKCWFRKYDI